MSAERGYSQQSDTSPEHGNQQSPAPGMRPRLGRPSAGYWAMADDDHPGLGILQHWPLEKRDPTAAVSDVVHPIVYRIDSTVPRKWVPWITKGILAWNPVFEALGFRHAVVVQDGGPPVNTDDDHPDPACVVDWATEYFEGAATGLQGVNYDNGEILHAGMQLNNGTIGLAQTFAFLYLGGLDPRMHYPYPDSVSGRLLQMMVSHEAGHCLGFVENFKAGTVYPTDSLRSAAFVHRAGTTASIMSYTFFDAVAQPEDHVAPEDLLARPGEYDRWALGIGYGDDSVGARTVTRPPSLHQWPPVYGGPYAVGSNLVKSADYVGRNLARTVPMIDAQRDTSGIVPTGSSLQEQLRDNAVNQWGLAMGAAIDATIGETAPGSDAPLDSAAQVEALRFAIAHVYYGRDAFVRAAVPRAPADTGMIFFDAAPAGWKVERWQNTQTALASHIVGKKRADQIASQSKTTHVLPVYCAELAALDRALAAAATTATRPEARSQIKKLQEQVRGRFDPADKGVCAAPAPHTP